MSEQPARRRKVAVSPPAQKIKRILRKNNTVMPELAREIEKRGTEWTKHQAEALRFDPDIGDYPSWGFLYPNETHRISQIIEREFFSIKEVAHLLGVAQTTVAGWVQQGRIRSYVYSGERLIRIHNADILRFVQPHPQYHERWKMLHYERRLVVPNARSFEKSQAKLRCTDKGAMVDGISLNSIELADGTVLAERKHKLPVIKAGDPLTEEEAEHYG